MITRYRVILVAVVLVLALALIHVDGSNVLDSRSEINKKQKSHSKTDWQKIVKKKYLDVSGTVVQSFLQAKSTMESSESSTIPIAAASGGALLLVGGGALAYAHQKKKKEAAGDSDPLPIDAMDSIGIEGLSSDEEDQDLLDLLASQLTIKHQSTDVHSTPNGSRPASDTHSISSVSPPQVPSRSPVPNKQQNAVTK